jgi:Uncharacterised nucleotidyltransferase
MGAEPSLNLLTRLLSEPPDLAVVTDASAWTIVKTNAARHGVAPLAAFIARAHVDPVERAWCDHTLALSWKRHEQSLQHLDHVLSILDEAAIPALVLKGPALACRYYRPAFLRKPSGDLDLAIRSEDLYRASAALGKAGYVPEAGIRESRAIGHHVELEHPSRPTLELHFRLTHKALGIPVAEFLDRAVVYALPGGRKARVLSPADEILHLVLHRASGRFATLFHLYEVRKIWAAASLETRREAVRLAALHHFTGVFHMTDIALRARWGEAMLTPDIPIDETWLQWRLTEKLYDEFERCSDPGRELPLTVRLKRKWLDFQMTDHPADALRFTAGLGKVAWFQLMRKGWHTVKVS